jgi:hypothetical protein
MDHLGADPVTVVDGGLLEGLCLAGFQGGVPDGEPAAG